jgi:hypothetical protein
MIIQAMAPKKSHTAAASKLDKEATQGFCAHSNNVVSLHTPTLADFTGFSEDLLRVLRSHFKHTEFNPSTLLWMMIPLIAQIMGHTKAVMKAGDINLMCKVVVWYGLIAQPGAGKTLITMVQREAFNKFQQVRTGPGVQKNPRTRGFSPWHVANSVGSSGRADHDVSARRRRGGGLSPYPGVGYGNMGRAAR